MKKHVWIHTFSDGNRVTVTGSWPRRANAPKFVADWDRAPDWSNGAMEVEYNQFRLQCATEFSEAAPVVKLQHYVLSSMIKNAVKKSTD